MKSFQKALTKAHKDAALFMSARLRKEALASGWPEHVVSTLRISSNGKEYKTFVHPTHAQEAMDYEYGTPDRRPTAAVRRFANRTKDVEKFLMGRMGHHLKGAK